MTRGVFRWGKHLITNQFLAGGDRTGKIELSKNKSGQRSIARLGKRGAGGWGLFRN